MVLRAGDSLACDSRDIYSSYLLHRLADAEVVMLTKATEALARSTKHRPNRTEVPLSRPYVRSERRTYLRVYPTMGKQRSSLKTAVSRRKLDWRV